MIYLSALSRLGKCSVQKAMPSCCLSKKIIEASAAYLAVQKCVWTFVQIACSIPIEVQNSELQEALAFSQFLEGSRCCSALKSPQGIVQFLKDAAPPAKAQLFLHLFEEWCQFRQQI